MLNYSYVFIVFMCYFLEEFELRWFLLEKVEKEELIQPKILNMLLKPLVNEEIMPSADTEDGAGTDCGRNDDGKPIIGLDIGRSPG